MLKSHNSPSRQSSWEPLPTPAATSLRAGSPRSFAASSFSLEPGLRRRELPPLLSRRRADGRIVDRHGRAAAGARIAAPFVRVAGLLRAAGVHAPEVLAQDLDRGFLLLTDLGATTYLSTRSTTRTPTPLFATRSTR